MADSDGPMPMKEFKPVPLNPNAADQFNKIHQGEYEARSRDGDESKNVDEVIQHNNAYPKLRNELHRRRSAVEIKACNTQRNDRRCSACEKLRQLAELKRLKLKPRCQGNRKRVSRRKGGVQKNKRIKKKRIIQNRNSRKRKIIKSRNPESDGSKDDDSNVTSLQNPDTNPSVSSFNSSSGLGQEPMDS